MNKKEIRALFSQKRNDLTTAQINLQSEKIGQTFFQSFDLQAVKYLHIFLSIPEKGEIDTQKIISKIWQEYTHIQLVSSKSIFKNGTLENYILNPDTILVKNNWGIPEPHQATQVTDNEIDIILIPLLAFDEKGYRVGYGKGFYDRFLANCKPSAIKIGLSLFPPILRIEDLNQYDIKMDYCIENERVWEF
jgi:5-formyltetrahydrofolate cyclo-ligase